MSEHLINIIPNTEFILILWHKTVFSVFVEPAEGHQSL